MDALERYLSKSPEIVFEWNDSLTSAKGWAVINSLKGGAAGGGTRMRKGLTQMEVVELAKTMEVKFNLCGPGIGGAKSGIDFDPLDPRKKEVLMRWFKAVAPLLKTYYGTAGDLNVDERMEVSPILNEIGIQHPQQGVLTGHYALDQNQSAERLERLKTGTSLKITDPHFTPENKAGAYTTADLITGYGVYAAIKAYYNRFAQNGIQGKRFFIQGWGNVGAAAGWYLAKEGGKIVLIQDKSAYFIDENGADFQKIEQLFTGRVANTLPDGEGEPGQYPMELLKNLKIDAFVPAAASRLVTRKLAETLIDSGLELIACGANVAFDEDAIIFGSLSKALDERVAILPDFIANCGVARLFSYLLSGQGKVDQRSIFEDAFGLISDAVERITESGQKHRNLIANGLKIYL
ncbi:MAG: amino acid dehydrogenase [Saprospiraceae bacterium]|nr:amino acid dehydrogenase [Saprospiraceae bacterium]